MVHQHFMLADNLTVIENIVLGDEPSRLGRIDFGRRRGPQAHHRARRHATGCPSTPTRWSRRSGVGERQRVEILKVLYRGARILILDEPTAVLVPQEVDELFHNLGELKREGITIIFISHKLDEVLSVADDITVIRAGVTVATADPPAVTTRELAELMVGSAAADARRRASTRSPTRSSCRSSASPAARATAAPSSTTSPHHPPRRDRRASPASRATARPSCSRPSSGCAARTPVGSSWAVGDITGWTTRQRRRGGHRLRPRGPPAARAPARRPAVGERDARPPEPAAERVTGRWWLDRAGARRRTEEIVERVRRAHAEHRRDRRGALGRQPAEADHRTGDARRAVGADRRPPHPGRRRRRPGRRSGTTCAGPASPAWPCCSCRPTSRS